METETKGRHARQDWDGDNLPQHHQSHTGWNPWPRCTGRAIATGCLVVTGGCPQHFPRTYAAEYAQHRADR